MKKVLRVLKKILRCMVYAAGLLFILLLIFAFTRVPFDMHRWLGVTGSTFSFTPTAIVMLGGSGMPSESNLIRLYYTKSLSLVFPSAKIIIAHPNDSAVVNQMILFLKQLGVDSTRISSRSGGTNTREQALQLKKIYQGIEKEKIVLVTSPEHMYRSLKTMRKLQFKYVGGVPAFENPMFIDLGYDHSKVGGSNFVPDVSGNLGLRYNFWNYFKLEITCMREYSAILYYKMNGWI